MIATSAASWLPAYVEGMDRQPLFEARARVLRDLEARRTTGKLILVP